MGVVESLSGLAEVLEVTGGLLQTVGTPFLTITAGFTAFFLSQIAQAVFVERIRIQARTIEEIAQALVICSRDASYSFERANGNVMTERVDRLSKAAEQLRRLAAVLRSSAQTLRWYTFFEKVKLVAPRDKVLEASKNLISLSNLVLYPPQTESLLQASRVRQRVEVLLGISVPD